MHISIPFGLILIFIAFSFFYYTNEKRRIRREIKRERYLERQQELMKILRKANDGTDNKTEGYQE